MPDLLGTPNSGVIVTGGGSGIGLATAHALAAVGRPVAIWDIDEEGALRAADALRATHDVAAIGLRVDVGDPDSIAAAVAASRGALPSLGGFVHSAGGGDRSRGSGFDPDHFDRLFAVHVRAVPLIVETVLEAFRAQPGSAIVVMSSMQARLANGGAPTYTAARGAVLSLVHSMADALAPHGVRINSVSPGMIRTPLMERGIPEGPARDRFLDRCLIRRFGEPDDVARAVRFLVSDEAAYITGTDLLVDGGFVTSTPKP